MLYKFKYVFLFLILLPAYSIADYKNKKETIYLISSSSQYDDKIVNDIVNIFNAKNINVDLTYLDQQVSDFGYVNTDNNRAEKLINALTDNHVKYLWFLRGGGGALNLIPYLHNNREKIKRSTRKIIIGFSDVTAFHYFLNQDIGWQSVHGVMAASNKEIYKNGHKNNKVSMNNSVDEIFNAIINGINYTGIIPLNAMSKHGVNGILTGGNLTVIQSFFSTKFEKYSQNDVLAVEDVSVTYRQLDRALHQLLYKNNFKPKGIIFGQFYPLSATDEERLIFKTVIQNFAEKADYPVFYYPYFGHGKTNNTMILAHPVKIECNLAGDYCSMMQSGIN